ncbi:unnamed protein product [Caenorhabditis auriculariae]|uniref:Uncharacterized protein n=1 Tax=Caenorhabditis auriculariae TaxID=2777116 RepID=A0A8S1H9W0_9PELO|nr:unnamed protein product [Caenorhabditis auriculariae]
MIRSISARARSPELCQNEETVLIVKEDEEKNERNDKRVIFNNKVETVPNPAHNSLIFQKFQFYFRQPPGYLRSWIHLCIGRRRSARERLLNGNLKIEEPANLKKEAVKVSPKNQMETVAEINHLTKEENVDEDADKISEYEDAVEEGARNEEKKKEEAEVNDGQKNQNVEGEVQAGKKDEEAESEEAAPNVPLPLSPDILEQAMASVDKTLNLLNILKTSPFLYVLTPFLPNPRSDSLMCCFLREKIPTLNGWHLPECNVAEEQKNLRAYDTFRRAYYKRKPDRNTSVPRFPVIYLSNRFLFEKTLYEEQQTVQNMLDREKENCYAYSNHGISELRLLRDGVQLVNQNERVLESFNYGSLVHAYQDKNDKNCFAIVYTHKTSPAVYAFSTVTAGLAVDLFVALSLAYEAYMARKERESHLLNDKKK